MKALRFELMSFSVLAGLIGYISVILGAHVDPIYLIGLLLAAVFAYMAYRSHRKSEREKLLEELRTSWGRISQRKRDFGEIRAYFDFIEGSGFDIDDRTWDDLDMDSVFQSINNTLTSSGEQVLYHMLRSPLLSVQELSKRGKWISIFTQEQGLREQIQQTLASIGRRDGERLASLLWDQPTVIGTSLWQYNALALAALFSPLLIPLWGTPGVFAVIGLFAINMKIHYQEEKRIAGHFVTLKFLNRLLYHSQQLSEKDLGPLDSYRSQLKQQLQGLGPLKRAIAMLGLQGGDSMLDALLEYLRIFFLLEVRGFYRAARLVRKHNASLRQVFRLIGELDALQSLGSYRASLPHFCEPSFHTSQLMAFEGAYHPLLTDPTANSLAMQRRGILITGSNMSGKSTFLRTVGVNALLAQTAFTCHAKSYCTPFVALYTSIGRADNVIEGRSYYLDEANSVLRLVQKTDNGVRKLCILDEIFRGTNSLERIAGSRRTLEYLIHQGGLVFVASHDLELSQLLEGLYDNYHFAETIGSSGLEFDFLLKPGPSNSRNALKLLKFLGYPTDITDKAELDVFKRSKP